MDHGLTERELQVLRLIANGQDQQGDCARAVAEREDHRSPRQQHLREGESSPRAPLRRPFAYQRKLI